MEQSSGTSTQLGAAHTQARQSCSQHSSGRLSDVCCVCVWGGGGVVGVVERMSVMHPCCTGKMGDVCVCVGGGGEE